MIKEQKGVLSFSLLFEISKRFFNHTLRRISRVDLRKRRPLTFKLLIDAEKVLHLRQHMFRKSPNSVQLSSADRRRNRDDLLIFLIVVDHRKRAIG